ncbi:Peroxidase [Rhynchospora pubera]|uniref:Peroxidase n=1 Tax=Rhynchospora pubera TaxID=906938 RepID=A0AAV8DVJ4_9POAL|nr:Peroxidase [Rhynchospora pubera]
MARKDILAVLITMVPCFLLFGSTSAQLSVDYYSKTCPNVEDIVRKEVIQILSVAPSLAAPFLRMHFHDCFVRGCDGSVLLDSTKSNVAEKDAPPNQSLRGFGAIERVKAKLEAACPNTVSCADVLALMARDAVWLSKGPTWQVWLGRRDGRLSLAGETNELPPHQANLTQLIQIYAAKGLDLKDLVVLSGAHTIGTAHCSTISSRLYNFTGQNNLNDVDPFMDKNYIAKLRSKCSPTDQKTLIEMDPGSYKTFDNSYFKYVAKRRSAFHSDWALLTDSFTRAYVLKHADGFESEFFQDFAESMIKMGNVGVLTGNQGEIRKKCYIVN